ncbi:MAG TPA: hypothetical protein VFY93_01115 [Planctomycetota bacterium]|nr:hypothetical protein [Planctomycetota bacterium]
MADILGLAPYLPASRPRGAARWWAATGALGPSRLVLERLAECETPPPVTSPCGLAAPCSLPAPFLDFLGLRRSLDLDGPPDRLFRRTRAFAAAATRGQRQPLRVPHESMPVLDRRRLPLFLAALPLLRSDAAPHIVEIDTSAVLSALDLPHRGLSGTMPEAVDRRAHVLARLAEGAFGFPVVAAQRDYAVASLPALAAVVACAMAARVVRDGLRRPADAETWVPLP